MISFSSESVFRNELRHYFNKPKSPYTFSINRIIASRENGFCRDISKLYFSSRYHVEKINLTDRLSSRKSSHLNFNRKGNLLCHLAHNAKKVVILDWMYKKIIMQYSTRMKILDIKFLSPSGFSEMVISTHSEKIKLATILPSGGKPVITEIFEHEGLENFVINPQTDCEIISVGYNEDIFFSDIRENKTHAINAHTVDKMPMLYVAHHPFAPQICVIGENPYTYIYDKRNMKRAAYTLGPTEELYQPDSCDYNNTGTEILNTYYQQYIDVYNNNANIHNRGYLYRFKGWKKSEWKFAKYMGPNSEYIVTIFGDHILFWDKKKQALLNLYSWAQITSFAVHPIMPVVTFSDAFNYIRILSFDNRKDTITFEGILNRLDNPYLDDSNL